MKLTLAPAKGTDAVRLGMTGDAVLSPGSSGGDGPPDDSARAAAATTPLFKIPATAIFHQGSAPAVWVIRANSTLELRPVTVRAYTERTAVVTSGLAEGDSLVLAGVHTVFAGQRVSAVKPLFADDGADVAQ